MKKHYSHFHDRTGEEIKNNQGLKMKIIVYNGSDDILVKFEDGYKVKTQYGLFKRGNINNPNFRGANFKDRTGETNINFKNLFLDLSKVNTPIVVNDIVVVIVVVVFPK